MSFADDERIDWDEFVRKFYITGSVTLMQCRFLCSDIPITIGFCDGVLCIISLYPNNDQDFIGNFPVCFNPLSHYTLT